MIRKGILSIATWFTIVLMTISGCANKNGENPPSGADSPTKVKIGLVTDEGGVNDKSFNQSADTGIKLAQNEVGIDYKVVESKTKEDYESNIDALVSYGCELTYGVGFQMKTAVENSAKKYTDKKFAIIDEVIELPNVESITFKEEEGSFLMGVIAGKMTKSNKIGFIGGRDFELINRFEAGFAAGVKAVNPEAAADLISRRSVVYVDSFVDSAKGKEAAKTLLNANCDVIYHAAGGVGEGMFQAIQEAKNGGRYAWGIGVDMDQSVTLPQYADIILSSMIKRVDTATYNTSKAVVNNTFRGGTVINLGLKDEGVGIATTTNKNTPAEVIDLATQYKKAITDGKITVPTKPGDVANFSAPEVK